MSKITIYVVVQGSLNGVTIGGGFGVKKVGRSLLVLHQELSVLSHKMASE